VLSEYRVDSGHVYFTGTSSDSQGYHYTLNCGSATAPATFTSSDGTDTITVSSGCTLARTDVACKATTPSFVMTEAGGELSFPGTTYTWSAACGGVQTVADAFTLTHD
jgi:poly(3-hydroxybutyrate) depolymerase